MTNAHHSKRGLEPLGEAHDAAPTHVAAAWQALHASAVAAHLPNTGAVRITGPDRVDFLNGQLANDVRACPVGGSVRSLYLGPNGHALDEVRVQKRENDLHLAVEDGRTEAVLARLAAHRVFDDVTLDDLSRVLACVTVQGPRAGAVIADALGHEPPAEPAMFVQVAHDGGDVLVVPHDRSLPGGFDVHVLARRLDEVVGRLRDAGAEAVSEALLDASRIEAGHPRAARDAGPGVLPHEAGLAGALSTRKGCYLGQETIARIEARANLRRGLTRLQLSGMPADVASRPEVRAGERIVGRIGSAAVHPHLGPISLAVIRLDLEPDTPLRVGDEDAAILAS